MRTQFTPTQNTPNLGSLFVGEDARREQQSTSAITRERELLRDMRDNPLKFKEDQSLYKEFMETFFYINPKGRGIEIFEVNHSQQVLLDAYFFMQQETPYVRMHILKGRQQGMSTMIAACAVMEMLIHPMTGSLIATENKDWSGKNLYRMYDTYLTNFQKLMEKHLDGEQRLWDGDVTGRFSFGNECELANESVFAVVGETAVTSRTLQFIHLSEAAFYHHLNDCMGMMLQSLPKEVNTQSSMFIETTAKMYGNEHHEEWLASCAGSSAFKPLFLPWYIHRPYAHPFLDKDGNPDVEAKKKFKDSLGDTDDHEFGNEKGLLELDNSNDPWRKMWPGIDFQKYGYDHVTLENLKFRRFTIRELKGQINEFNRQYPTTPDMAFLSKSAHVLDMNSIRWYMENQMQDPKAIGVLRKTGYQKARFVTQRGGIIVVWEGPLPDREYLIGVDVAEGLDTGDYSCAYVVCRNPFKIVARLRGAEGRAVGLAELIEQLNYLGYYYNTAWICVENNGSGEAVTQGLAREGYPLQVREATITKQSSPRFGWRSTKGSGGTRDLGISLLQETIANRNIGIPCQIFIDESHHFHYINGRAQAARKGQGGIGSFDDSMLALVSALLAESVLPRAKTEHEVRQDKAEKKNRVIAMEQHRKSAKFTDYKRYI